MSAAATALPPGPRAPRAVQTMAWVTRPGPFMRRCHARYGDVFTVRIAQEGNWVFLAHPDLAKQVFTGDPRVMHAGEGNAILGPIVGDQSVLLLDEGPHIRERKLLLPPFHGERMQRYGELMTEIAEAEIERWPRGEPLALWPRMQAVTLEIIMRTVFGIQEGGRLDELRRMLSHLLEQTTSKRSMALMAALGPERIKRLAVFRSEIDPVDDLLLDEIRLRREDPGVAEREDILSLLVQARHEDGEPMGDRELRDELMTLLVAGHETTATSLAWAFERLVRHPEKLERLREEADAPDGDGDGGYLDAVVKETLRLRPVLPIVVRKLTQPMEIGGYRIPAGASLTPCIYLIHRREDVYLDPTAFRPERFLERPAGTYTWIPFGGGVRRCLGASFAQFEMKRVLAAVAGRLDLRPAEAEDERVARRAITLTPSAGARVVATARASESKREPLAHDLGAA
ncbi:MAG: cytochrome P450 [Actinomycetota bacterium]